MLTHVPFKILACYYLIYRDILEARIRLDLVNFLARSGSKQKFNGSRLARLEKPLAPARKKGLDPALIFPSFSSWKNMAIQILFRYSLMDMTNICHTAIFLHVSTLDKYNYLFQQDLHCKKVCKS